MLLRHIGFRQRIIGILAGGALVTAAIVGFCLHELSALQSHKDDERLAERRGAAIHAAVVVILQAATTFSSLALDLNDDEKKQALADGECAASALPASQGPDRSAVAGLPEPG